MVGPAGAARLGLRAHNPNKCKADNPNLDKATNPNMGHCGRGPAVPYDVLELHAETLPEEIRSNVRLLRDEFMKPGGPMEQHYTKDAALRVVKKLFGSVEEKAKEKNRRDADLARKNRKRESASNAAA